MRADLDALEAAIGYRFRNREFLFRALTHTSHAYEQKTQQAQFSGEAEPDPSGAAIRDNEQLEFLGDAVLGFLISECLIERYPSAREGRLSILKNYLVSASHLYEVAQSLELGEYLLLGRGEELSGGRVKKGLLADAVEALIAAMHLDGGIEAARGFIRGHIFSEAPLLEENAQALLTNFKGSLQEVARSLSLPAPRYVVVSEHGPAHSRSFTVEVRLGEDWSARATGDSKKEAGQKAAQAILKQLMETAR